MIAFRGLDLTASPQLAQQFLQGCQNSLQTGEPMMLPGYTPCTTDPEAEFFGNVKMAIACTDFVQVGENEILLNCDSSFVVRDIKQNGLGFEVVAEQISAGAVQQAPQEGPSPEPGQKSLRGKAFRRPREGQRVKIDVNNRGFGEVTDADSHNWAYVREEGSTKWGPGGRSFPVSDLVDPETGERFGDDENQARPYEAEFIPDRTPEEEAADQAAAQEAIQQWENHRRANNEPAYRDRYMFQYPEPEEPEQKRLKGQKATPPIGSRVRARPNANVIGEIQQYENPQMADSSGVRRPMTGAEIGQSEEQEGILTEHNGQRFTIQHPANDAGHDMTYFIASHNDLAELPPEQKRLKALRRKWLGKAKRKGPQVGQRVQVTPTVDRLDQHRTDFPHMEGGRTIAEMANEYQYQGTYDGRDADSNHIVLDEWGPNGINPSHADVEPLDD